MTVFTDTWNAAFEALPADSELVSLGADRIRDLKVAIQERGEVDHKWAGDTADGYHVKMTCPVTAAPSNPPAGYEVMYCDGAGSWHTKNSAGTVQDIEFTSTADIFAAGTALVFFQAAAPTAWTKSATHNNKMLRVVSGAGGGSGGSHSPILCDKVASHTHTVTSTGTSGAEAAHTHAISFTSGAEAAHHHNVIGTTGTESATHTHTSGAIQYGGASYPLDNGATYPMNTNTTTGTESATHTHSMSFSSGVGTSHTHAVSGTSAAGSSHTHTLSVSGTTDSGSSATSWAPYYIDVIVCTKD